MYTYSYYDSYYDSYYAYNSSSLYYGILRSCDQARSFFYTEYRDTYQDTQLATNFTHSLVKITSQLRRLTFPSTSKPIILTLVRNISPHDSIISQLAKRSQLLATEIEIFILLCSLLFVLPND